MEAVAIAYVMVHGHWCDAQLSGQAPETNGLQALAVPDLEGLLGNLTAGQASPAASIPNSSLQGF
jgi:hypothetical protein